jgi:hypothetical protein
LIGVLLLKGRLGSGRLSDREQILIAALARSMASGYDEVPAGDCSVLSMGAP